MPAAVASTVTSTVTSAVAVALVAVVTALLGGLALRLSRTTSDFYVASRAVSPLLNASAIGGEYLSAASFLGVAGLVLTGGVDMLWYPVGYTAGYLVLLVLVAAPLRRSGAYTLPDFAALRLGSNAVRTAATWLVVLIGWLYLVPQLQGAGLTLHQMVGTPTWVGGLVVIAVVLVPVLAGGMRSITFAQAFQFWLKLTALAVPACVLLAVWRVHDGAGPDTAALPASWVQPFRGTGGNGRSLYATYSLVLATLLGTMGLPHVLVRFYTNPDGRDARRTTRLVLVLLSCFYVWPPVFGALGRIYAPELAQHDADAVTLLLPERVIGGTGGVLLGALVTAGAFAAFLSTSSGLTVSVAGVLSRAARPARAAGETRAGVRDFRVAAVAAVVVPYALAVAGARVPLAAMVGLAFAVAASSFCPLLILGIWWRRLTPEGALAGLVTGGGLAGLAVAITAAGQAGDGWAGTLLAQPAAWTVPIAFAVMVVVSLATPTRVPADVNRVLTRLHTPDDLGLALPLPIPMPLPTPLPLPFADAGGPPADRTRPLGESPG
ncbi:MAG: sodium/solute symporter [Actinomycetales bacterium]